MTTTAALAGSTGLVGSHILTQLLAHPTVSFVQAYTRKGLENTNNSLKLTALQSQDSSTWASMFPTTPAPQIFLSALGTTRGNAGGVEAQRKIDLDLNYDLAKAAKDAGCSTYVLISSASANSKAMVPYSKMKGELEDKVRELGFKHAVILRPGLIVGNRQESRPAEAIVRGIATGLGKLSPMLTNSWAQDADVIARAAISAGLECVEGKKEPGVWELGQADIVRLGKK